MLRKPRLDIRTLLSVFVIAVVLGVFSLNLLQSHQQPTCDGQVMSPGDTCDVYTNGQFSHTDTYEDRVQQAQNDPLWGGLAGVGSLALFGLGTWMIVSYWRKRTAYEEIVQRQVQSEKANWPRR